jgi:hypothetical protein
MSTEGLVMAHPGLQHSTAEALGVRSLRYRSQQQEGGGPGSGAGRSGHGVGSETIPSSLPCLSPMQLGAALGLKEQV